MDWLLVLAIGTFVLVIGYLLWNWQSTKRNHESGGQASGIGGKADPLAGNTEGIRPAGELRTSLDTAAAASDKT